MTIFYLDFEGGNDANDGLSFANRWKTIAGGATAARTAPGDTIRVMATPDPVSLGSATWTDNSGAITFAAAKNKVIDDCEAGWVASTNVTATYPTGQKTGAGCLNLAFAAGFTTGKAAYKALGSTLDLSAFEQLSFWYRNSGNTGNSFSIKLCSDSAGDTPVATLPASFVYSEEFNSNVWKPAVLDLAAALGSGINSIAIYMDADPGTVSLRFDNIVAAKAAGSADEVTHKLIYGKNTAGEPEWYNIHEITDAGIVLGAYYNSGPSGDQAMPYRGPTESVTTYKRYCFAHRSTTDMSIAESGAAGSPITYSGGWNRTDMSTQTGETWLSGDNGQSYGLVMGSSRTYVNTEKFGFVYCYGGAIANLNGFQVHDVIGIVGCLSVGTGYTYGTTAAGRPNLTVDHVWGCNAGALGSIDRPIDFTVRLIHGDCDSASNNGAFSGTSARGSASKYQIQRIENNRSNGIYCSAAHNLKFRGTTLKNNLLADVAFNSTIYTKVELEDCELLSATKYTEGASNRIELHETRIGGDPLLNSITRTLSYFKTQAATVHSGAVAWEMGFGPNVAFWAEEPEFFPLAAIACNAGTLVTVKVWLRRDNAGVGAGLFVPGNAVQGITETTVWMTAAADTWEEVTITFTPATAGVFEVMAAGYGPVGNKAFFDGDITVTQA